MQEGEDVRRHRTVNVERAVDEHDHEAGGARDRPGLEPATAAAAPTGQVGEHAAGILRRRNFDLGASDETGEVLIAPRPNEGVKLF